MLSYIFPKSIQRSIQSIKDKKLSKLPGRARTKVKGYFNRRGANVLIKNEAKKQKVLSLCDSSISVLSKERSMRSESELNHLAINNSNNSKTKNLLGKLMKALAHPIIQKKPNHLNSTALSFIIDISPVSNAAPSSGIPLTMTAQNGFTKLEEPIKYAPCKTCQELNLFCPNTNEYVRPAYNSNHSSMSTAIFYGNAFRNWFEEIYFPNGTEFDSSVNSCSTLTIMNHSHKRDSVVSARSDFDRDIEAEAESFIHRSEKLCLAIEARLSDLSPHNVNSPKMVSEDSATTFTETMSILRQKHLTI